MTFTSFANAFASRQTVCSLAAASLLAACGGSPINLGSVPVDGSSASDASAPEDSATSFDGGTGQLLYYTYSGYDDPSVTEVHEAIWDTTVNNQVECGGGNFSGAPAPTSDAGISWGVFAEKFLVLGHSYEYRYWFDTDNFECGPVPTHHVHAFGPVTGDTYITLTPSDPVTN